MTGLIRFIFGIGTALAQDATATTEKAAPFNILAYVVTNLPLWITAAVVLVVSLALAFVFKKWVENRLSVKLTEEHQELLLISGRVTFVAVAAIGITIALAIAGINLTTILAAVAFGISFGLQDTIANFVAGLGLLASQQFSIGDWISVGGQIGKVEDIRTRATFLKTYDGIRLIVPNANLYKAQVLNYTSNPIRRMKVPAYCRYGVSLKDVVTICTNVVKSNPKIYLEPKPNVIVVDMADYYIELQVRFWVDSRGTWRRIASSVFADIQKKLEESGMDSPYPVTNMNLMEDGEAFVFKTKSVDNNEYEQMKTARMAENEDFALRRDEILKMQLNMEQPHIAEVGGVAFLKAETGTGTAGTVQAAPQFTPVPSAFTPPAASAGAASAAGSQVPTAENSPVSAPVPGTPEPASAPEKKP